MFSFSGQAVQNSVNIILIQSMRIKEFNDSLIKIEPGNSLKLVCDAMIDERILETVTFNWYKNDQKLPNTKSEFSIDSVDKTDAGSYKCRVSSTLKFLEAVESNWNVSIISNYTAFKKCFLSPYVWSKTSLTTP